MSTAHIQLLRYLWAGLRLTDKAVTVPNGNVVQGVRHSTMQELLANGWIEPDPDRPKHFRLTPEGRARALVKQRVEDFLANLPTDPTT